MCIWRSVWGILKWILELKWVTHLSLDYLCGSKSLLQLVMSSVLTVSLVLVQGKGINARSLKADILQLE